MADYAFIKVRKIGEKRFNFLRPDGGETHLRVHAAMVPVEKLVSRLAMVRKDNPGFEFKATTKGGFVGS
jgi:hypothetical protein